MTENKTKYLVILTCIILWSMGLYSQSIERIAFSAAASGDNNFQPMVGAPFGVAINSGSGSLEVSSEYGESAYVNNAVNVKKLVSQSSIKVYPNPSKDKVVVDMSQLTTLDATISVMDLQGKVIIIQKATANLETIDLSVYSTGVYLLKVLQKSGLEQSFRIIKK